MTARPEHDHKRADEPIVFHHHREANGQNGDSHARWIICIASVGLVAVIGWLAAENYRLITSRLEDQRSAPTGLMARSAERDQRITALEANQNHILESLTRIEEKQELLLRKVR